MPFLPLFIVIGIFLAISKTFQSNQQPLQSASKEYDEQLVNQALIDYIAHISRSEHSSADGKKISYNARKQHIN
ncbi:hypothetical protein [Leptothoe sp. PORK10 BA2]|uniref:hypothetical protein n=1 Tax=Leptothoe sp. PORK10 BA2 TaxID=3110254 RepID=UPI002B20B563|nr:hypothetical protein [Leptothoe sp. PORK10 BA2]MEA5463512.1 hypothetical protein [Leptothoe sp. PORK10 BA2]